MLLRTISLYRRRFLVFPVMYEHTETCPVTKKQQTQVAAGGDGSRDKVSDTKSCPSSCTGTGGEKSGGGAASRSPFQRPLHSAPVRLGFLPDNWFTFFHSKTGVTGPYLFLFNLTNYLVSKEIYVMEHEYYLGLSAFVVIFYVTKKFGKDIGTSLDKLVDAYAVDLQKGRNMEIEFYNNAIMMAKDAQRRADGQKMLMDAKKENVAMQLEAIYRERAMLVYRAVRGRMDYHIKLHQAEARIHQKWLLGWVLENVHKSITPDFLKQALQSAIDDLASAASRAN